MSVGRVLGEWKSRAVVLLPSCVVLLFALPDRWMPGPTAAGLAFLAVIIVAYFVFPRTRLNIIKIVVGLSLALLVAYLIADISLGHK